jgi:hypothetical protein
MMAAMRDAITTVVVNQSEKKGADLVFAGWELPNIKAGSARP